MGGVTHRRINILQRGNRCVYTDTGHKHMHLQGEVSEWGSWPRQAFWAFGLLKGTSAVLHKCPCTSHATIPRSSFWEANQKPPNFSPVQSSPFESDYYFWGYLAFMYLESKSSLMWYWSCVNWFKDIKKNWYSVCLFSREPTLCPYQCCSGLKKKPLCT